MQILCVSADCSRHYWCPNSLSPWPTSESTCGGSRQLPECRELSTSSPSMSLPLSPGISSAPLVLAVCIPVQPSSVWKGFQWSWEQSPINGDGSCCRHHASFRTLWWHRSEVSCLLMFPYRVSIGVELSRLQSCIPTIAHLLMVITLSSVLLQITSQINYGHPSLCLRDFFWRRPIQDIDKSITSRKDMGKGHSPATFPSCLLTRWSFGTPFISERSPILPWALLLHQMPSLEVIVLPNAVFLYIPRPPQGTGLWQPGNWHRTSSFLPLCQFSLSFVYQNWLELLPRFPGGGQTLQTTMAITTSRAEADRAGSTRGH